MELYHSYMKDNNINNFNYDLDDMVNHTLGNPILEDYLNIYLQTDEGKKEIDVYNTYGYTELILAVRQSNGDSSRKTIKILIKNGSNVNLQNYNGETALMFALQKSNISIVKLLIKNGAYVNLRTRYGYTTLMNALGYSNMSIAKLLIKKGANVNLQNSNGETALMHVCSDLDVRDSIEIVKLLIESGANVNLQDTYGNTALIYALKYSNKDNSIIEILKLLLENI